jgi:hypothetical protein
MEMLKKYCALGILSLVAGVSTTRADINPNVGSFTGTATTTGWNYTINVTTGQEIVAGDFFTIYDFGNFVPGSNVQPADWNFSSSLSGVTPPGVNPSIDDPAIANLTWTYTGAATIPTETFNIGPFGVSITGTDNTQSQASHFAGWGTRVSGDQAGTNIANAGSINVPLQSVPEPPTVALIFATGGIAVVGRAFIARFRRA